MFGAFGVHMDANMQNPYESGNNVLPGMNVYCENLVQSDSLKVVKRS